MKKRIASLVIALVSLVAVIVCFGLVSSADDTATKTLPAGGGKVVDVWLVSGQSNAIGAAKIDNYPTDEAYAEYKTLLTNGSDNVWHLKNTDTAFVPAGFSQGSGTQSGPEIGITTALDGSANMNAIIKVAYGNTSLYDNTTSNESIKYGTWTPPSYIDAHGISTQGNRTGDLYLTFIAKVAEGLEKLVAAGYTPNLKGVWFMQGEADTLVASTTTERYEELLLTLISDMRADLTEVSGLDCSELPFVYGRILRKEGSDAVKSLAEVQAAQDNVANNKSLKNVFMINTSTDLVDPVTGEHRLPTQQDAWHYDSLSQQMIGEKFVSLVNGVEGTFTKYGYIPETYSDAEKYPFAVFKNIDGKYVFDSAAEYVSTSDTCWATTMTRAITLTKANGTAVTEEVVVLLRRDLDTTSFLQHTSDIGATVTVDLNGYSFASRTSLCNTKTDDCLASGATEAKNGVINVKNGTLLMGNFGILYAAKNGTYTKEKTLTFNFENLNIGFADNATKQSKTLLGIAYDSHAGDVVAKYEMNFVNCVIDSVTNCPTDSSYRIADLDATGESAANGYNNAVSLTFKECTIKVKDVKHLEIPMSAEGDSITFLKGKDGSYGHLLLPSGTDNDIFVGNDNGNMVDLKPVHKNGVYYLVESDDVVTEYGIIPAANSNSYANPFAIFKKVDGAYVFDGVQGNINTVFTKATELTHAKTGVTDDVVILLRRNIVADGSFPSNVADAAGTITLDLAGYNLQAITALIRTDFDDDGVVNGEQKKTTVNIKNGSMELRDFGILFTTLGSTYTVSKTFDLNLENVKLSFYPGNENGKEGRKNEDLLVSDRNDSATTETYINITATNCTFDLEKNTKKTAYIGTLNAGSGDDDNNNYTVTIIGGTIITDNIAKATCSIKGTGDKLIFKKDSDGNYTKFLMNQSLQEPASTEKRIGEGGYEVSFYETSERVGVYKVYDLRDGVVTKYGVIPEAAAENNFVVFVRNDGGTYAYNSSFTGWKGAFEAARNLTNGSSTAYDEAMILMLKDSIEGSVPYHQDACGIINLDLNGKTLNVRGSFFNTYLVKSNSPTSVINVFDGTLTTRQYGLIYTALKTSDTSYETAGVEKTITLNFSNVNLGFEARTDGKNNEFLAAYAYNGSPTLDMTINMNFDNCKFDLVNNATSTTLLGRGKGAGNTMSVSNTIDFNLAFTGCEFYVYNPSQISITMSAEGDSFAINKGADGKYATVITNSAKEETYFDIISGNNGTETVKLRTDFAGVVKNHATYELVETDGNITISTAYAPIPQSHASTATYPFVVFYKNANGEYVFSKGYASYKDAMTAAINLTKGSIASPYSEAVVLLRTDVSAGGFPNYLSAIATTVTVDLNGYTLGALESLGNTQTGDTKDPSGKIVKTNGTINYKNGSILLKVHPGLYIASAGSYTAGYEKTLNVNYDNVYIGVAEGAKTPALLGRIASNHTTAVATFNLKYTNCTIDMLTNGSSDASFCIGNWVGGSGDHVKVVVDFIGCDFIGLTEADITHKVTAGQDVIRYSNIDGGHYATLTLPKDAAAPTGTYTIGTKTASFVKISETETGIVYALRPTELVGLTYAPKMSLTLDRNLIMNVYIPVNSTLEFTFNGEKYTNLTALEKNIVTLDDGNKYYRMTAELPAAVAAQNVMLNVKIDVNSTVASGTFNFSIPKYSAKILADANATEVEKTLVRDVLLYVKSAYVYFNTKDANAMASIDALLGTYTASPTVEGEYSGAFVGVNAVTFVLDGTPAMRFYLEDAAYAGDYKFYIDGKQVDVEVSEDGTYVDIDVYAYALTKTVTYTVNGKDGGSYHVRSYYDYVSGTGANCYNGSDKAELTALVASFWNYLQSAADYRASVIGN